MNFARAGAASVLLLCAASAAAGQSLGEIARKIEEARKAAGAGAVVYDDRDMNPALARRDLLSFRLDPVVWQRFLVADRNVAKVIAADPGLVRRLSGLNYVTLRSVGRFFQREAAVAAALAALNVDPHEYANVYLATKLAMSDLPDALAVVAQQNNAFLKKRAADVATLAIPLEALSLHALAAPLPPTGFAAPPTDARAPGAVAAVASTAPDPGGVIDMSEGATIPDFEFIDFEGRRRQLSDFRGRYLMLDFWGSWCPPCRAEVPFVKDAYARFGSRGFEVLALDSERGATVEQVRDYLNRNGVKWTFATPDSVKTLIDERFQIPSFPRVILLDPDGKVIEARNSALRGENLARTLDRILPR